MTTLRLGPADREALSEGARRLDVELAPDAADRLVQFSTLLESWSAKTNLISCRSSGELVERHLLDSLAVARHLESGGGLVDLGSGAGFPGIPLAVACAATVGAVSLVEPRRRRANFLRAVKRELDLGHVRVLEQRAEAGAPDAVGDARNVVCRAVWSDGAVLSMAERWTTSGGRLLWMRGEKSDPLSPEGVFEGVGVEEYRVGGGRPRAIHIFRRL